MGVFNNQYNQILLTVKDRKRIKLKGDQFFVDGKPVSGDLANAERMLKRNIWEENQIREKEKALAEKRKKDRELKKLRDKKKARFFK